ncbi:hypothetical protein LTR84_007114 [Exophiala bonariae]|uniref:Anaphase-promoting complex subunit 13 n=1 Tax=Exophiala bonariae TaxID=1690606 RepID=A0AAV9N0U0_9EURO|nr:hypothetical protein LTR84_007114 [Exophiala bonariae]
MSRDSSATHLHLASSRYADLFEEFCRPPSSGRISGDVYPSSINGKNPQQNNNPPGPLHDGSNMTILPGSFLPFEEIHLPPHLMPLNPEDEDGVVPDMHAAFGITRALGGGASVGMPAGNGSVVGAAVVGAEGSGSAGGGAAGGESSLAGVQREPAWRDLGLGGLMADGVEGGRRGNGGGNAGTRREGRRTGLLFLR